MFNVHRNVTADGVPIRVGLRVITNNLDVGTIVEDPDDRDTRCCGGIHAEGVLGTVAGQRKIDGTFFTDHKARQDLGCDMYCGHDHWFTVEYDHIPSAPDHSRNRSGGRECFNGERLGTKYQGMTVSRRKTELVCSRMKGGS